MLPEKIGPARKLALLVDGLKAKYLANQDMGLTASACQEPQQDVIRDVSEELKSQIETDCILRVEDGNQTGTKVSLDKSKMEKKS